MDGQGEPTLRPYVEYEYSDALLIRLLQAHCPEFKKTTRLVHTGPSRSPIRPVENRETDYIELIRRFSAENLKHETPYGRCLVRAGRRFLATYCVPKHGGKWVSRRVVLCKGVYKGHMLWNFKILCALFKCQDGGPIWFQAARSLSW